MKIKTAAWTLVFSKPILQFLQVSKQSFAYGAVFLDVFLYTSFFFTDISRQDVFIKKDPHFSDTDLLLP